MDREAILAKLDTLRLPNPAGAIIVAGAAMAVLGIRTTNDIDLVVDDENWRFLSELEGWEEQRFDAQQTRLVDPSGEFDVWNGWVDKRVQPKQTITFDEIVHSTVIDASGYRIPTVPRQILMKQQLARPKDQRDIELLTTVL